MPMPSLCHDISSLLIPFCDLILQVSWLVWFWSSLSSLFFWVATCPGRRVTTRLTRPKTRNTLIILTLLLLLLTTTNQKCLRRKSGSYKYPIIPLLESVLFFHLSFEESEWKSYEGLTAGALLRCHCFFLWWINFLHSDTMYIPILTLHIWDFSPRNGFVP